MTKEIELLQECKLQLEYLNEKCGVMGTTNLLLARINKVLLNYTSKKSIAIEKTIYPLLTEAYTDNGGHSHWRLIDKQTGDLLWTEAPEEDKSILQEQKVIENYKTKLIQELEQTKDSITGMGYKVGQKMGIDKVIGIIKSTK